MRILRILKTLGLAGMTGWILSMASCAPVIQTTAAAQRLPVEKRSVLVTATTPAQRETMLAYVASKYGGFQRTDVRAAVILSVNGQAGTARDRDPRGSFNRDSKKATLTCESGRLKVLAKPFYFFDGNPTYDDLLDFEAKPGHQYFVGYAGQLVPPLVRWVPVVYDRTTEKIVHQPHVKPKVGRLPASAMAGPPMMIVL